MYAMSDLEIREIISRLERIESGNTNLMNLLKGDDFGNKGLVERTSDTEKDVKDLSDKIDRFYWSAWIVFTILLLLGAYINLN